MVSPPAYTVLGQSRPILEALNEARFVSATDFNVLLTGESGVGKRLIAQFIHENSPRRQRKMLSLNCAGARQTPLESELFGRTRGGFSDAHGEGAGLFEKADGSTLLLDDVGGMSRRMQTLLFRVLEKRQIRRARPHRDSETVDVRIISATNRDLLQRSSEAAFRVDLYYRLNVTHLQIPPLRARAEDISPLLGVYLKSASEQFRLPLCELHPSALATLNAYSWPGNIRELRDVAELLARLHAGRVVAVEQLPQSVLEPRGPAHPIGEVPAPLSLSDPVAVVCYERITHRLESFWTVVYEPFIAGKLTAATVRAVVARGLQETNGSYKAVTTLFNLPPTDHKRLLTFLQQYNCHPRPRVLRAAPDAAVRVSPPPPRKAAV